MRRSGLRLDPDPARVVARIFLPGQEHPAAGQSRSSAVLGRILDMSESAVVDALADLMAAYGARHHDIEGIWWRHWSLVEHRMPSPAPLTRERKNLIGAYFTQEYSIEGAALFNPSMVAHPDQGGLDAGSTRFLLSLRAVGEGHVSSIEWRCGVVDANGTIEMDASPDAAVLASPLDPRWSRSHFADQLVDMWGDRTNSDFVLDSLPEWFTRPQLDQALHALRSQRLTRGAAAQTLERFEWLAACSYRIEFPETSSLAERVIMPRGPAETHGMEDARIARLVDDDTPAYAGTYTAYDGARVSTQVFTTEDFRAFEISRLSGPGSRGKGMALFPRRIAGRYVALSRTDRESNGITTSVDLLHWDEPVVVQTPHEPWEVVQLGNCGPPLETEAGWVVLTHGVGPMREYSIGAILLDLDDPTVALGSLRSPLLTPQRDERSGYVPNVVYSCGAMRHGDTLVLPFGCSDSFTRFAVVDLEPLLAELVSRPRPAPAAESRR